MSALQVSKLCKQHGVLLIMDACRFAENAYFIKIREEGFQDRTVKSIAQVSVLNVAILSLCCGIGVCCRL